jgi:hypothetical protein
LLEYDCIGTRVIGHLSRTARVTCLTNTMSEALHFTARRAFHLTMRRIVVRIDLS